jgi:potassium-dependent mechanosensitive channel
MMLRLAGLVLCLLLGLGVLAPARAQAPAAPPAAPPAVGSEVIDFSAWEAEAARIENLIEAGTASTAFFGNLRETLVGWRARFLSAQTANEARLATIRGQIDALGPAPAEGESEAPEIATRRAQLNAQLADAQLPRVNAAAALTRANGLINEIDLILRERQQQQLLQLDPSPVNPVNWPSALVALRDVWLLLDREVRSRVNDPVQRGELADAAPGIAILAILGLLAILRGRRWTERLTERLQARARSRGRIAVAFLVSLLQITVPLVGVIMLLTAALATGLIGPQGAGLLAALGGLAGTVYISLWLAGRLFREDGDGAFATLRAQPGLARAARRVVLAIGLMVGVAVVLQSIAALDVVPPAARGVLQSPAYVLLGYLYWRLARLLRTEVPVADGAEDGRGFAARALALTATALVILAFFGPFLALVGYVNATEAVMVPTARSLALIGLLLALQPVVRDLYAVVFRKSVEEAGDALLPVLVNFLLAFAALPLFALIWGARPEQLSDVYGRFWEGVTLGEARLTPGGIFAVVLVFAFGLLLTRLLQGALKSTVLPRTRLDPGARTALTSGIGYLGIGIAAVVAITAGGIDLTALGVVIGALSVGIGFGLQNVVNNFVSGIILLVERPISEGDWIEVNGTMGIVRAISVRSTRIETFDRTDVIVPNADFISGTVTNWTRGNTIGRAIVTVGVAYGTDTRRVQQILLEIAREHPVVAAYPEPGVDFMGFGADSLEFRIRAILRDVNQLIAVKTEMHHRIAERFREEGIEIPFAQRDIWLRNPEALLAGREAGRGQTIIGGAEPAIDELRPKTGDAAT